MLMPVIVPLEEYNENNPKGINEKVFSFYIYNYIDNISGIGNPTNIGISVFAGMGYKSYSNYSGGGYTLILLGIGIPIRLN
jgi:hypothetical protein